MQHDMLHTVQKSLYACPICSKPLYKDARSYLCSAKHCFDISKSGEVNLLTVRQKHSAAPGDDKDMVHARADFLSKGYYAPLLSRLQVLCAQYTCGGDTVLDLGCGEGYYTSGVYAALREKHADIHIAGVDISKTAAHLAAKAVPDAQIAVASVFHLPLASGSVALALNCFSPLCVEETLRVLAGKGRFIYVVPGARHLWGLKSVLYASPYENEQKHTEYKGFRYLELSRVQADIRLASQADIQSLFGMTPYFWKTSAEDKAKLASLQELDTPISFDIHVYEKL